MTYGRILFYYNSRNVSTTFNDANRRALKKVLTNIPTITSMTNPAGSAPGNATLCAGIVKITLNSATKSHANKMPTLTPMMMLKPPIVAASAKKNRRKCCKFAPSAHIAPNSRWRSLIIASKKNASPTEITSSVYSRSIAPKPPRFYAVSELCSLLITVSVF